MGRFKSKNMARITSLSLKNNAISLARAYLKTSWIEWSTMNHVGTVKSKCKDM